MTVSAHLKKIAIKMNMVVMVHLEVGITDVTVLYIFIIEAVIVCSGTSGRRIVNMVVQIVVIMFAPLELLLNLYYVHLHLVSTTTI
jgi:hypothetical protein